ncbi:MAG: YHS domain-containing (seleno)protein [Pseudomonadota bacterium]
MRLTHGIIASSFALGLALLGGQAAAQQSKTQMMMDKSANTAPVVDLYSVDPSVFAASFSPIAKNAETNVAIGGYDPVSYFGDGGPALGAADFQADYLGATFRFVSAENRAKFLSDPKRYAPQHGGYCVKNLAEGKLVAGDPLHWSLDSDRLYFTFSQDAKVTFDADRIAYRERATDAWSQADRLHSQFGVSRKN